MHGYGSTASGLGGSPVQLSVVEGTARKWGVCVLNLPGKNGPSAFVPQFIRT